MSNNNIDDLNETFESTKDDESIADSNDGAVVDLPIFNPLSLQILPSAANPAPSVQFAPVTPGQTFAMSEDCISGLSKDAREFIANSNDLHKLVMLPPSMDKALISTFMGVKWPEGQRPPKEEGRENLDKKYPGLLRELDLKKQHTDMQHILMTTIAAFDALHTVPTSETAVNILLNPLTHSIQVITDKMSNYTHLRRRNLFLSCPRLKPHIDLIDCDEYYERSETLREVFGETFRSNLMRHIREQRQLADDLAANTQSPSTSKQQNAYRYVSFCNSSTYFPPKLAASGEGGESIKSNIHAILHTLKLPIVDVEIGFINILDVNFTGGRIREFFVNWNLVTGDQKILNTVAGHKITFCQKVEHPPNWIKKASYAEKMAVNGLLRKGVIEIAKCRGFVNNIFLRAKSSGGARVILDMSTVNESIEKVHFKMTHIETALSFIKKGDFFIKLDLTTAYDCVNVEESSRKYLQFLSDGVLYQYVGFPNGLSEAPRYFTLLLKPVMALLGLRGCRYCSYLDDLLMMDGDSERLKEHGSFIIQVFMYLGFLINTKKSILEPTQSIEFLGFLISSISMKVTVPTKKQGKILEKCSNLLNHPTCTRRELASVIGSIAATTLAIKLGPLHYRGLQRLLCRSDKKSWDHTVHLDHQSIVDLRWWTEPANIQAQSNFAPLLPTQELFTDASKTGWGAIVMGVETNGFWSIELQQKNINLLELLAIYLALEALRDHINCKCLCIRSDNVSALSYIRKKGGTGDPEMTRIATKIWEFAAVREMHILVQHIPGKENSVADRLSRMGTDFSDWKLEAEVFLKIVQKWGPVSLDLFASSSNCQVPRYFSWKPEQGAEKTNALYQPWPREGAYAFPPFCLIPKILQKIQGEEVKVIVVTPVWKTAPWYPKILTMCAATPLLLPNREILTNPAGEMFRTQRGLRTRLAAWMLSGIEWECLEFQAGLQTLLQKGIGNQLTKAMPLHTKDSVAGAVNRKLIPFLQI